MVRIKLVGCNFNKTSNKTIENDVVRLIREPENKFDKEAIAVYNSHNEKIGYVGTAKTVSRGNRKNGCVDKNAQQEIRHMENEVCRKQQKYF